MRLFQLLAQHDYRGCVRAAAADGAGWAGGCTRGGVKGTDLVQIYSVVTNSWAIGPKMRFGRSGMGAAVFITSQLVGEKIFILGGESLGKDSFVTKSGVYDQIDVLDVESGKWTEYGKMEIAKHGIYPLLDPPRHRIIFVGGGVQVAASVSKSTLQISLPLEWGTIRQVRPPVPEGSNSRRQGLVPEFGDWDLLPT